MATYSPTVSAIKDALYTYGPLVTTMDVYTDFFNYSSGVYSYVSGVYEGGHAILIVGYDDAGGYFIVKNSWGSWGKPGYFKIAYSQLANKVEFGWYTIAYQAPPQASYTVNTNPPGLQVTVDGSVYTSPHTFTWSSGTVHTIGSSSPQLAPDGRTRYVFSSWNDAGLQTHQVTAPAVSTTYVASFVTQYSLTSTVNPSAGGSVTLTPNAPWYDSGQAVQARIIPSAGYTFSGWSGDLSGTANPASVTMNGPKAVTANLTQNQYTLAAIGNPSCSGSVIKAPDKGTYVYGDNVQLRATANPGYAFSAWGADGSGSANPVTIVINGNKSVTANFNTATPPPSGQGQWRVRFLTETGDTITTTTRPMGQYFIHGEEATLTMILHGPLSFVPTCPDLGISPVSGGNCTLAGDGGFTARAGQAFSFSVSSLTPGTTLSASDLPINASGLQATFNPGTGIFQWSTSPNDVGTYSVVFQAAVTTPSAVVSQFVVPMNITP